MIYKEGDWVICDPLKKEENWYHTKPMKIIGIESDETIITDFDFSELETRLKTKHQHFLDNTIVSNKVYYFPMREEKLKRILENI